MEERHARLKRRRLRDQRRIMGFLYVSRGNEREAGGAGGHDVGMVAEDRQRRRGERPCRDMKHRRGQLPGYLEHVGQHQHQPLRGGEGRGHRSGLQRAMDSAGGPSLALHLLHLGDVPPDVLETFGRPLVGQFSHGRRRSDREDRAHLIDAIGDMRDGGVAVHRRPRAHHLLSFRIPTGKPARVASRRLGDHFHGVAGTLLDAHRAARAERVFDLVAAAGAELEDGVLRTGGEAIVAFETIAA